MQLFFENGCNHIISNEIQDDSRGEGVKLLNDEQNENIGDALRQSEAQNSKVAVENEVTSDVIIDSPIKASLHYSWYSPFLQER